MMSLFKTKATGCYPLNYADKTRITDSLLCHPQTTSTNTETKDKTDPVSTTAAKHVTVLG
ncbi:MAG: hypothetical protein IPN43_11055 [Chitinophagaceae bacterium]|nr:hypothetical protein [Chitinophagaceae bacterium]